MCRASNVWGVLLKVVIAGDVPLLRSLVRMAVEEAGYRVVGEPDNPEDLLAICSSHKISIIVMDLYLPDDRRMRVIEKILDIDSNISIIAVADIVEGFGDQVLIAGARAFLQKPFSMYDLIDMMRKVEPIL
jgi:two-component system chemotaxis response regulator CheY